MIVDFRVRPPYKSFLTCHIFRPRPPIADPVKVPGLAIGRPPMPSFELRSWEVFLREVDDARIDHAVVMGRQSAGDFGWVSNDDVAEIVRGYAGRFIGFAGIDPSKPADAVREVKRAITELGFRGVSMEPGWCTPPLYPDDPLIDPVYEVCQQLGAICAITASIFVGPDLSYSDPIHIQRVALRYPNLRIAVSHACWPHVPTMLGVAMQCLNVYLVPDFYGYIPNMPMALEYARAANYYLGHRMLYASSYPVRPLGQSIDEFRRLPLEPDVMRRCLADNAVPLLGLKTAAV